MTYIHGIHGLSGSHTMGKINPQYPLFVLAFFIVKKSDYVGHITPAVQHFKFKHFGHDQVILHERDIRKDSGDFSFLKTPALKNAFLDELTSIIAAAPFRMVSVVIDKIKHKARYTRTIWGQCPFYFLKNGLSPSNSWNEANRG